jgi:predicted RNA-binding Zn-ribbon protein involved in translation (DUF1610 family)
MGAPAPCASTAQRRGAGGDVEQAVHPASAAGVDPDLLHAYEASTLPARMTDTSAPAPALPTFRCPTCGDVATYAPGTERLRCGSCGGEVPVEAGKEAVVEEDLTGTLETLAQAEDKVDRIVSTCRSCGAETTLPEGVTAGACAFCGTAIVAGSRSVRTIRPKALLPFRVTRNDAVLRFRAWIRARWFAPGDLRRWANQSDALVGVYLPHWTFDAGTVTSYVGQRGDHYVVTVGSGKRRRTEVRTRWRPAWGTVSLHFDDLLVPAGGSLPAGLAEKPSPGTWRRSSPTRTAT